MDTTTENVWETFLIDNIDLNLSNNTDYVFELDAHDVFGGYGQVAATPRMSDLYTQGVFVFENLGNQYDTWDTGYWGNGDLAFVMETSSVPEPATMLLFGTGLVGLAGLRRRKKSKAIYQAIPA